jgi:hypothetical protein
MNKTTKVLSIEQIYRLFKKWMKYPSSEISRHIIMFDLLTEIEKNGISTSLYMPCLNATDEEILKILEEVPE